MRERSARREHFAKEELTTGCGVGAAKEEKEHAWREMEGGQPEIRSQATNLVSEECAGCGRAIPTLKLGGQLPDY